MNRLITAAFAILLAVSAFAQSKTLTADERQKFRAEMRNYKHEFLTRELELSKDQQRDFFPIYDEMSDEVDRIGSETRRLEKDVTSRADASDVEVEAAARAVYSQKYAEGEVEQRYYERFKQVLKPRQLLKLRSAERKFMQQLMRKHNRHKTAAASR